MQTAIVETAVARECGARSDDAFGHVRQSLRRLERRARRIHTHYRTVEERFPSVLGKSAVILGACAANHDARVVGRSRHHAEHFARARVESHDRTYLTFHKAFAQSLQFLVDGEREVFSGNRLAVVFALHILPLDASASIAQQYLHALLAAQLFLVRLLHAELADVVARLVVAVFLNVVGRNLCNVAEDVRTYRRLILAYAALLDIETREAEYLLLKVTELLRRKLTHEHLLREARVAWVLRVVLDVVHALYEILFRDAQSAAELKRVDASLRLVHHHHDIVRRLVVHEQTSVAVVDGSARRIFNLLEKGVRVGVLLVVVAQQLQRKEPHDVDNDNCRCHESDDVAPFLEIIIAHFLLLKNTNTTFLLTFASEVLYHQYEYDGEQGAAADA